MATNSGAAPPAQVSLHSEHFLFSPPPIPGWYVYVFTTRRITACHNGNLLALNPAQGLECHFGNFKGYPIRSNDSHPTIQSEIATITAPHTNTTIRFEYETGNASMAPIYAAKYWQQKHPTPDWCKLGFCPSTKHGLISKPSFVHA